MKFFDDFGMDFAIRCVLSGVRDGAAEVGEVLLTVESIKEGDPESYLERFCGLGRRLAAASAESLAAGNRRTSWGQALRAANYLFAGAWWAPGTSYADQVVPLWREHRAAWDLAVDTWPAITERKLLDTPQGALPTYWFRPNEGTPVGAVVMIQGLDTPLSDAAMSGLSEGLRRGYAVMLMEGPGQGEALFDRGLTLADSWDGVVPACLESARGRISGPVTVMGINHGSYFVLDAATKALDADAIVVDPAAYDLATDLVAGVSDPIQAAKLAMAFGSAATPESAAALAESLKFDPARLAAITAPVLQLSSAEAESFAGQSQIAAQNLGDNSVLQNFAKESGAALDCEIGAPQVRNAVVYDWLDALIT